MSSIQRFIGCFIIGALVGAVGCGSSGGGGSTSGGASMDAVSAQADAQAAARKQQDQAAAAAKAAEEKKAADAQAAQAARDAAAAEKKAVGSRPAMEPGGYYSAIAGAHRHVMNVVDSLSWIQGVRSFKAEVGRKPKNNDEFMKVVVTKYELQLPRIEEDEEYLYDPNGETDGDFGQLYVVKKQTAAAPASGATPPAQAK